jgi:hypothetical protein
MYFMTLIYVGFNWSLYMLAYENQMSIMASSSNVHDNDKISCE